MDIDLVGAFLDVLAAEKGMAANTIDAYQRDLAQLEEFFEKKLTEIDEKDIRKFIRHLADLEYASTSVARKISALNDFFKFLLSEGKIEQNPLMDIARPKKDKPLPQFLIPHDIVLMIDAAEISDDLRHKRSGIMLKLMYACGLRVSELVELKIDCLNISKEQILVKGKGSKERLIPIAASAIESVLAWMPLRLKLLKGQKSSFLFPSTSAKCGHLTRDTFFKNVKRLAMETGLDSNQVHPHVFRHSFATHLMHKDVNLRAVQKMLGHEDISTTEIYTHILSKDLLDDISNKHPLSKRFISFLSSDKPDESA